ncbi:MAG TPA: HRDC domain-containing protein [Candidatus Polarisedimenticolaceae bacterium]|nr:HRDC domain-containing protein [Candidatus Polarisedimenticolaceae bacterium]
MSATWIDGTEALDAWLGTIEAGPVAVDTEADSFHHYREKVCLIQLSAGSRHALVDPLASIDLAALRPVLADPSVEKLLHGADYDVRLLHRDLGFEVRGLFDTMIAARLAGEPAFGLAALLEKHLRVTLDKAHQRADWSKRPLTAALRDYAVADTRFLAPLAEILRERLAHLGRTEWAREECERIESVRWRERRDDDPEPFRKTKGSRVLDRAGLAVLREIWGWRDAAARGRDKPPFRILRDEVLVALAKSPAAAIGDLAQVAGFPEFLLRSPAAHDLVAAAQRGAAAPQESLPEILPSVRPKLDPQVASRVERCKAVRDVLARDLELEPSILASRGVLEEMARREVGGGDPWTVPELRTWQMALLRPRWPQP